jgi:two-component system invasion response regulator UvrY
MDADARRIRVLVAEDNRDLAAAICALIAAEPDMQVDTTVDRVSQLVDAVTSNAAHVLVLDLNLQGESSMQTLLQLQESHPRMSVVIYSGHDLRELGPAFAHIERCEYVAKASDPEQLIGAIRRAAKWAKDAGDEPGVHR